MMAFIFLVKKTVMVHYPMSFVSFGGIVATGMISAGFTVLAFPTLLLGHANWAGRDKGKMRATGRVGR